MIHPTDFGTFVISAYQVWRPGNYADRRTARYAARFSDENLERAQAAANDRGDGVITWDDLAKLSPALKPAQKD